MIETDPVLDEGEPFPTLWWLSCRALSSAVSRLESEGIMTAINRRLEGDESFRQAMESANANYISARDSIAVLSNRNHPGGGPDHVKCLHAHVAHHLVTGDNPVGQQVSGVLGWNEPKEPCV